jgi:glycogen operon protein
VSYNAKHNEANGEGNRDGTDDNISYNYGFEGDSSDPAVRSLRARAMRNFLATLCISQGVPMLLHGDEVGRSQRGNNNVYCQDNETTWVSWDLDEEAEALLAWTRRVMEFRRDHAILRRRRYFQGREIVGVGQKDIAWLKPDGTEMSGEDWSNPGQRTLAIWLAGAAADVTDDRGEAIVGDTLCILMNSSDEIVQFRLPPTTGGRRWTLALDSYFPALLEGRNRYRGGGTYQLQPRSIAILKNPGGNGR